jgi:hypothetical protein
MFKCCTSNQQAKTAAAYAGICFKQAKCNSCTPHLHPTLLLLSLLLLLLLHTV